MHTQNPCSCGRPLPTHTSTGDAQTQFCLSLCGIPGSWCAPGLFEPSEHLWWEWGLILNVNLPLLPSYWGFSFALGCGESSQSHSSAYHVTVFVFFFFFFLPWTCDIFSRPLLLTFSPLLCTYPSKPERDMNSNGPELTLTIVSWDLCVHWLLWPRVGSPASNSP